MMRPPAARWITYEELARLTDIANEKRQNFRISQRIADEANVDLKIGLARYWSDRGYGVFDDLLEHYLERPDDDS